MRIHCVSSHSKDSLSVVVFCYMLIVVSVMTIVVSDNVNTKHVLVALV